MRRQSQCWERGDKIKILKEKKIQTERVWMWFEWEPVLFLEPAGGCGAPRPQDSQKVV